jgi:diguanylate cyclase (GGDEF)-like protein
MPGVAQRMEPSQGRAGNVIRLHAPANVRQPGAQEAPVALSFVRLVERQLQACRRYGAGMAVVAIRLDGLAELGARHGEEVQERLMDLALQRLKGRLRGTDTLARIGDDAFGVALFHVNSPVVSAIEARLFDELSAPYRVGEVSVEVMAMTGAAVFPRAGLTASELVDSAQQALQEKCA